MNIIATNGNLLRQKRKRTGENVAKNEKQRNTCISRKYEVYLQGKNEKDYFIKQLILRKRYENKTAFFHYRLFVHLLWHPLVYKLGILRLHCNRIEESVSIHSN